MALRPLEGVPQAVGSILARRWHARTVAADSVAAVALSAVEIAPDLLGVGERHQCSVTLGGTAQCSGDNDGGQLGDGSRLTNARLPRPVVGVMRYAGLGAGASHTCGVTEPGDVYCWGANADGELGDGTTIRRSAPVRIAGTGTYRLVRGGRAHTCALDVEGQVRCWGSNVDGQLGDGTQDSRSIPTLVRLPAQATAVTIAVGDSHSCAVLNDNRVVCWGSNASGQVGEPGHLAGGMPRVVPGVRATAIAAGAAHTCAVLLSGPVRCWGRDDHGQLGAEPARAGDIGRLTVIPGGEDVRALTAGAAHTCALTRGGWAWCWGRTSAGARRTPARVGRGPYVALVAGGARSCAIPRGRVAECWSGADVWTRRAWARRGLRRPRE
jgi:alpha-tubulin suppressor-like RCC1 family protein